MNIHSGIQLAQKQTTKLMITAEMKQHIALLQFSRDELIEYVQEQLIENPMLETEDQRENELEGITNQLHYLGNEMQTNTNQPMMQTPSWENYVLLPTSLHEYLENQLSLLSVDPEIKRICQYLIGNLDEYGYLDLSFSESDKKWTTGLSIIQSLEPIGVGARTFAECLEIQLQRTREPNAIAIQIVRYFLAEVANGNWKKIAKDLGVEVWEVQQAVDEIKLCNPRPCSNFSIAPAQYVFPDVMIKQVDGVLEIQLDKSTTSQIRIHKKYLHLMKKAHQDPEVVPYLKNCYQSALSLIKGVEQRHNTIYQVTKTILDKQRDFFQYGIAYLKPLTLKRVADDIGLHESTISRATQNKYMQTPHGLFPFRFFFPAGINQDIASNHVRSKLQQLIDQESKTSPLSDQKLADLLQKTGVPISRRTVTKYREQMGIASSKSRKRYAI
jgi:RNA polymerase sigma-54 factor